MRENEYYQDVLKAEGISRLPIEQEIYLRKIIRKDVKEIIRLERRENGEKSEDEWDPWDEEARMDDKVIYGSSSDEDIVNEIVERIEDGQYESDEDLEEMEFETEEAGPRSALALDYDKTPKVGRAYKSPKNDSDSQTSDSNGNDTDDSQSSNHSNSTIEMVDLSVKSQEEKPLQISKNKKKKGKKQQ